MADHPDREHFIPLRRADLVDLLCADRTLKPRDGELFREFCRQLAAIYHFEYKQRLEALKTSYAPFDPDRDTAPLAPPPAEERTRRLNGLFRDFGWLLEKANFKHLTRQDLEPALGGASDWGIRMDVDYSAFERIALFARGDTSQVRARHRLRTLYRKEEAEVPVYQRLVIILKMRKHARLPPNADTENVHLKIFKNIPKLDVNMLLPGARVRLTRLDRGRIGVPLVSGFGMIAWRTLSLIGRSVWNLGDDFLEVLLGATGNPLWMWIVASGAAGYGYQSYYGYKQTKQRYHLTLTESLYYQNLDSNAGVLTRLLDEAEEQEAREAILAYYSLWRYAGEAGWTAAALDDQVEHALQAATGLKVDFEIEGALAKLEAMRIVRKDGDRYRAVPVEHALRMLDWFWDNYFKYNNPGPGGGPPH